MIKVSLHDFALPTIGFLIRLEPVPVGNWGDCRICEEEKEEATKVAAPLAPSLPWSVVVSSTSSLAHVP